MAFLAAFAPLLAGAGVAIIYCGLLLWHSSRYEAEHVRHVNALMAAALAELRASERALLHDQFDRIIADNWPEGVDQ